MSAIIKNAQKRLRTCDRVKKNTGRSETNSSRGRQEMSGRRGREQIGRGETNKKKLARPHQKRGTVYVFFLTADPLHQNSTRTRQVAHRKGIPARECRSVIKFLLQRHCVASAARRPTQVARERYREKKGATPRPITIGNGDTS